MAEMIGYDGTLRPQSGGARISSAATGGITPERVGEIANAQPQWGKVAEEAIKFGKAAADYGTAVKDADYKNASVVYGNHVKVLMDNAKRELDAQQDLTDEQYQTRWLMAKADVYQRAAKETNAIVGSKVYDETTGMYKDSSYAIQEKKLRDGYGVAMEAGFNEALFARRKARTENTQKLGLAAVVANAPDIESARSGAASITESNPFLTKDQKFDQASAATASWVSNQVTDGRHDLTARVIDGYSSGIMPLLEQGKELEATAFFSARQADIADYFYTEKDAIDRWYSSELASIDAAKAAGKLDEQQAADREALALRSYNKLLEGAEDEERKMLNDLKDADVKARRNRNSDIFSDLRIEKALKERTSSGQKKSETAKQKELKLEASRHVVNVLENAKLSHMEDIRTFSRLGTGNVFKSTSGNLYTFQGDRPVPLLRKDGTQKGAGWLATRTEAGRRKYILGSDGSVITEAAFTTYIGGKEVLIPAVVPDLTPDEEDYIAKVNGHIDFESGMGRVIAQKAWIFAMTQMEEGKSVWAPVEGPQQYCLDFYNTYGRGAATPELVVQDAILRQRRLDPDKDPSFFEKTLNIFDGARMLLYGQAGGQRALDALRSAFLSNIRGGQDYAMSLTEAQGLLDDTLASVAGYKKLEDVRKADKTNARYLALAELSREYAPMIAECSNPAERAQVVKDFREKVAPLIANVALLEEFTASLGYSSFMSNVDKVMRGKHRGEEAYPDPVVEQMNAVGLAAEIKAMEKGASKEAAAVMREDAEVAFLKKENAALGNWNWNNVTKQGLIDDINEALGDKKGDEDREKLRLEKVAKAKELGLTVHHRDLLGFTTAAVNNVEDATEEELDHALVRYAEMVGKERFLAELKKKQEEQHKKGK